MKAKINCAIRDKEITKTAEEIVRQKFIKILMEDYQYSKADIKVEYRTKRSPSDTAKSYPVDIAVIENEKPKIFIETKKEGEDSENGLKQLKNYMQLNDDVVWGIWTNGLEKLFLKKVIKKSISFIEVFDIPKKNFHDVSSQLKKSDLAISNNLKFQFQNIRAFITGHAVGTNRDEKIAQELIKIVLCKTYDEKFKGENETLEFYHENNLYDQTSQRIKKIYKEVKQKYSEVFKSSDDIELDPKSISYCVSQLQKYSLTNSNRNVISDAFETIIGHSLKGSQGQFFTPKNIIKMIIHIVKPSEFQKIIDPAVGSGGFLVESMLYNWNQADTKDMHPNAILEEKKDYAMKNLFGIEKDEFLGQICKSYMAVLGDGKSGIFIDNSLEDTKNWNNNSIQLGSFDLVLTNPPFGKEIKMDPSISNNYLSDKVDIAFLERSISLLKDNGTMAIILSEVVFHAPTYNKFRKELMYKYNITHLIDLPHDTFRPFNNAKCIVLILEKNQTQQENITLINLKEIGHDHKGVAKYEYDYEKCDYKSNIIDDTEEIIEAFDKNHDSKSDKIITMDSKTVIENDILIPRYYFNSQILVDTECVTIDQLIEENVLISFEGHGSPQSHLKGMGDVPYIRVKDIGNFEIIINDIDNIPEFNAEKLRRNISIQEKDIVMVRRGSYRIGDVGFVYPKDCNSIYTKELQFFRVTKSNKYGITQNNLLFLLSHPLVKKQIKNMTFIDTTLPTLYKRWSKIKLPLFDLEKMESIDANISKSYTLRSEFWETLND